MLFTQMNERSQLKQGLHGKASLLWPKNSCFGLFQMERIVSPMNRQKQCVCCYLPVTTEGKPGRCGYCSTVALTVGSLAVIGKVESFCCLADFYVIRPLCSSHCKSTFI